MVTVSREGERESSVKIRSRKLCTISSNMYLCEQVVAVRDVHLPPRRHLAASIDHSRVITVRTT